MSEIKPGLTGTREIVVGAEHATRHLGAGQNVLATPMMIMLLEETCHYTVAPYLAPDGPVVAIGVDNEAQMFFRLGAYDFDYHPDALAWWRDVLDVDPPRAWDRATADRCAAWVRFKDQYLARALGDFAGMLDAAGFAGLARFHNLPPTDAGLYDLRGTNVGGPPPKPLPQWQHRVDQDGILYVTNRLTEQI